MLLVGLIVGCVVSWFNLAVLLIACCVDCYVCWFLLAVTYAGSNTCIRILSVSY